MTKANRERLYAHYVKVGYLNAAKDMLSKHPELEIKEFPVAKEPKVETKSKGKK